MRRVLEVHIRELLAPLQHQRQLVAGVDEIRNALSGFSALKSTTSRSPASNVTPKRCRIAAMSAGIELIELLVDLRIVLGIGPSSCLQLFEPLDR